MRKNKKIRPKIRKFVFGVSSCFDVMSSNKMLYVEFIDAKFSGKYYKFISCKKLGITSFRDTFYEFTFEKLQNLKSYEQNKP